MRKPLIVLLAVGCVLAGGGRVAADAELQAVIDKAVQAHGGREKLAKLEGSGIQMKGKGTIQLAEGLAMTMEMQGQKDKFKLAMQFDFNGMNISQTQVFDGQNFWITVNGQNIDVDAQTLAEVKEQVYAEGVARLTFLKEQTLSALGEVKVNDRPAVGIRVMSKGHRDVSLFFDKEKGLLVKIETRVVDYLTKQEVTEEKVLEDYKEIDGWMRPTKVTVNRDGKKLVDMEITELKIVDRIDDSVFAKP
jgi:hypothetical protein